MKKSMKFMFEHFKVDLEPACETGIAALTGPLKNKLQNQNTLIILCGSNIDMKNWTELTRDQ
jgi:threonine dehydratase